MLYRITSVLKFWGFNEMHTEIINAKSEKMALEKWRSIVRNYGRRLRLWRFVDVQAIDE